MTLRKRLLIIRYVTKLNYRDFLTNLNDPLASKSSTYVNSKLFIDVNIILIMSFIFLWDKFCK